MEILNALKILEIEKKHSVNYKLIKKQYHKLALLHHPDKNNNTEEAKKRFQELNEAFLYLKQIYDCDHTEDDTDIDNSNLFNYTSILMRFMSSVFDIKDATIIQKIFQEVYNNYEELSFKLFDGLSKSTCLSIYNFILKYQHYLHIPSDKVEKVRSIILEKYSSVLYYKIIPNLEDLMNDMAYQIKHEEEVYIVPLWHHEVYFENEMIVLCEPELPENTKIDIDNNIIINYEINEKQLLEYVFSKETHFTIDVGGKKISVPLNKISLKPQEPILFKREGISKIKDDIYDLSDRSDIILYIHFVK